MLKFLELQVDAAQAHGEGCGTPCGPFFLFFSVLWGMVFHQQKRRLVFSMATARPVASAFLWLPLDQGEKDTEPQKHTPSGLIGPGPPQRL